ncbi:MAG: Rad52/Rad22 family DNA repair protein [Rikenellaceae bacterium]
MEQKTPKEIADLLAKPFAPEDLEWRLQRTFQDKMTGIAVPYLNNRAIQNRLDEVVGPENWQNEYRPWQGDGKKGSQLCGISIHYEERGWVTKWDGAENSDIEPVKGGLSDSMKRAAVQWGIGRALYSMDTVWVDVERKGNSLVIGDSQRAKLNKKYLDMLNKLGLSHTKATGIEAQLTPHHTGEAPAPMPSAPPQQPPQQQRSAPAMQNAPAQHNGVNVKPFPVQPQYQYIVTGLKVQQGFHSESTELHVADPSGKTLKLYYNGIMQGVTNGTWLVEVQYSTRTQNTVVFNVLEHYRVISAVQQQAA